MALYLGNNKVAIHLNDLLYKLNFFSSITNNTMLISTDGYILKDINNSYLTVEREKLMLSTPYEAVLSISDNTVQGDYTNGNN